jgi:CheY-like chemotaxis protein
MNEPMHLLLVEDDSIDVRAMQRALAGLSERYRLSVATDGRYALDLLKAPPEASPSPPSVVLLDLNLPRMGGLEFLGHMRQDPALSGIPVFVLTTSNNSRERREAYRLGVSAYILKDRLAGDYSRLLKLLDAYLDLACVDDRSPGRDFPMR